MIVNENLFFDYRCTFCVYDDNTLWFNYDRSKPVVWFYNLENETLPAVYIIIKNIEYFGLIATKRTLLFLLT